jgi:uncharacterized OB-fold protein
MNDKKVEMKDVEIMESPVVLRYDFSAGYATSKFLRGCKEGKLIGQRSPATGKVIAPPRGSDPESGEPTVEEVQLKDTGTVASFTIVHIPIPNNPVQPPYIIANIVLDGCDQTFIHLISECNNADIKIGTRIQAVWKDKSEWDYSLENIKYFKPLNEPTVDVQKLKADRLVEAKKHIKGGAKP